MKKILIILLSFVSLHLVSCRIGLDELPVFDEADIKSVRFETRWVDSETNLFQVQELDVGNMEIDNNKAIISLSIIVPPSSANFPVEVRNTVNLNHIIMICDLSNAATSKPIGTTPKMGMFGDFSQAGLQYEVLAADGKTKKTWTIEILDFVK